MLLRGVFIAFRKFASTLLREYGSERIHFENQTGLTNLESGGKSSNAEERPTPGADFQVHS